MPARNGPIPACLLAIVMVATLNSCSAAHRQRDAAAGAAIEGAAAPAARPASIGSWAEPQPPYNPAMGPPVAHVDHQTHTLHGGELVDDYGWLRERDSPEVLAYLEAENAYTEHTMAHTAALQETLYGEMLGRIEETDLSVPARHGDYFYYSRTVEGAQYPIYCRKRASSRQALEAAEEEVLLDVNRLAKGHDYFRIGGFEISPDHRLLAYLFDTAGDERYTLVVRDIATGALLADRIDGTTYGLEWGNDNRTLFYVMPEVETNRPYRLQRHVLGSDAAVDEVMLQEDDERFGVGLGKTRSRRFLVVAVESSITSEVHLLDADQPGGPLRLFAARRQGVEYAVDHQGEHLYVRTNEDAKNFKLLRTPVGDWARERWQEVLPHRPDTELERIEPFEHYLVVVERHDGLRRLQVRPTAAADGTGPAASDGHYVDMPEPVYSLRPTDNLEYDSDLLRFQYTSLVTPESVFDYDMGSRTRELLKQEQVLGGYDPADYVSERISATADDGTQIPISLVYRRGVHQLPAPTLLNGYGSYGASSEPFFSSDRLSLLDRGMVYAIAHIRGGGEMGEPWHDGGKLLTKRNTFTDFIACAEHLIAAGYSDPQALAISGRSAGGLLIGAVLNLRPDLFTAAMAGVPFVDVMNTMLDPSIPLTVTEYEEWGNPNEEQYFDYMLSYSPYDNVHAADYPHLLITGGLNDPRVQYWEPAKWAAKLRATKTGDHRLLLKTNMGAGHSGASGRYGRLRERAFEFAFFLDSLGLAARGPAAGGPAPG